jgi:hypothetical protein
MSNQETALKAFTPRLLAESTSKFQPSSDSTRSNEKAESKPDDSSPPPAMTTALNSSDSSDVHAIALGVTRSV